MRVSNLEYWMHRRDKVGKWVRHEGLYWRDPIHRGRKPKTDRHKDVRKGK